MGLFSKIGAAIGLLPAKVEPTKARPSVLRETVLVPAGHVMPLGEPITQAFNILVEAGARWHPEWDEPRITVNAWRFMAHGDAMGWSGNKVQAFNRLLPKAADMLSAYHGKPAAEYADLIDKLGLAIPAAREPMASFVH